MIRERGDAGMFDGAAGPPQHHQARLAPRHGYLGDQFFREIEREIGNEHRSAC